jgi:hypothetical protein
MGLISTHRCSRRRGNRDTLEEMRGGAFLSREEEERERERPLAESKTSLPPLISTYTCGYTSINPYIPRNLSLLPTTLGYVSRRWRCHYQGKAKASSDHHWVSFPVYIHLQSSTKAAIRNGGHTAMTHELVVSQWHIKDQNYRLAQTAWRSTWLIAWLTAVQSPVQS